MKRILFVCLGNICRSPTAEGVTRHLAEVQRINVDIESAGTGGWHVGDPPDKRMIAAAARRGIDLSTQRARQVSLDDFYAFDYILAMDRNNLADLEDLKPADAKADLSLFLGRREVPDPYYGGAEGFDHVIDLVEQGAAILLDRITADL